MRFTMEGIITYCLILFKSGDILGLALAHILPQSIPLPMNTRYLWKLFRNTVLVPIAFATSPLQKLTLKALHKIPIPFNVTQDGRPVQTLGEIRWGRSRWHEERAKFSLNHYRSAMNHPTQH